jgi:hypothetical protein
MINPVQNIPNRSSASDHWIEWYKSLKGNFGKKQANMIFVKAWGLRGGAGSDASTVELREYMKSNGVTLDTTSIESIQDTVSGGLDSIGDFFTMGKWVGISLIVIVVGGLGLTVYNIAKQPIKAVRTATKIRG